MDKREILEKSRKEYGIADEREKLDATKAASIGMWIVFAVSIVYSQIKVFVFGQTANDIMAIAFLGASAMFFAQYFYSHQRSTLVAALLFLLVAFFWMTTYVLSLFTVAL